MNQLSARLKSCPDAKAFRVILPQSLGTDRVARRQGGTLGPHMHTYKLMRQGALVQVFVDGQSSGKALSANQRNELRDFMASFGLAQADIDFKVHELYLTNATSFTAS